MKNQVCTIIGIVGGAIATAFGGWDTALAALVTFMAIDYITGLMVAGIFHTSRKTESGALESLAGWKGLCRKGVTLLVVLAVLIALALNRKIKGRGFFRTTALIPWAVPSVIAALTFRFLYDANVGIINAVLKELGILADGISWLGNLETARWAVVIESIWKGTPFVMIFVLAALQSVPHEMYESARVDGAGGVKTFFKITLPMIKETLGIATILTTIGTINNFNAVWLMTQGGPLGSTEIMFTYAYRRAFSAHNFGQAAAISVIMFIIIALCTFVYTKLIGEEED